MNENTIPGGMMKTLIEKEIGTDGAKAGLYVDASVLQLTVSVPLMVAATPLLNALDPLKAKLEAIIPGDWENPLVDKAFADIKAEILALITA